MKILFWVSGTSDPSPRFRFLQFVEPLRKLGYTVDVEVANPPRSYRFKGGWLSRKLDYLIVTRKRIGQALVFIKKSKSYDVVFTNKDIIPNMHITFLEKWLSKANPNLLFDIDDAIYLGPRGKKLKQILRYYKAVIAGSPVLQKYIESEFNCKAFYIPMAIDMEYYKPKVQRKPGKIRIGWSGSHHTNIYALPILQKPLEELSRRIDFQFVIISNKDPEIFWQGVDTTYIEWNADEEVEQLQYLDIGLMPLNDGEFERGKCALKAVQYMAVGIPALISPVGVNEIILQDGQDGFHFNSQDELLKKLERLIADDTERKRVGEEAYKTARSKYAIDVLVHEYIKVFEWAAETGKN